MIEVLAPGIFSSVQDIGRYGHRKHGVPVSGAMDQMSFITANRLVGNTPYKAAIEVYLHGLKLKFHEPTYVALTGSEVAASIDGNPVSRYSRIKVDRGSELHIQSCKKGLFCYVGINGGIVSETVLESQSFYTGITPHSKILKGDQFPLIKPDSTSDNYAHVAAPSIVDDGLSLDAFKGPEWHLLGKAFQQIILDQPFEVGQQSSRMAFNLESDNLTADQITTSPVQPGTVQMMPSGKMSVLMRDAQTTGGYSRILQLTPESVNRLAQVRPGNSVFFHLLK